jgi:hypothetical protein
MTKRTFLAMVLAWLIPGAGHYLLGRRTRAIVFAAVIFTLFVSGLLLDGKLYVAEEGKLLSLFASLGSMGIGIPYFIGRALGPFGDYVSATFEYGTAFTLTAGLMNLLLVLDAFDISEGRKQ